jgi:hypothetical protein
MPTVETAAELYGDRLVVIGIHDNSLPAEGVRDRLAEDGPHLPVILDSKDGTTVKRYGVESFPTYVLIDPEGRVAMTTLENYKALRSQLIPTLRSILYGRSDAKP